MNRLPPAGGIEIGSSPSDSNKELHPNGWSSFLVDDIGLEPMTFRTSSGCSSQLCFSSISAFAEALI